MPSRASHGEEALPGFDIRSNLRQVLTDLKEIDPALARGIRKKLRASGDRAVAAMKQILEEEGGGVVTGKTHALGVDRLGRARIRVKGLKVRDANRSRSTGARKEVESGLSLRVTAGKSRTSVRLVSAKGALRKPLNKKSWRHPVFASRDAKWVEQPGNQYFNRGAFSEMKQLKNDLEDAIREALDVIDAHSTNPTLD